MQKEQKALGQVLLGVLAFSFCGLTTKWMPWSALSLVGVRAFVAALFLYFVEGRPKLQLNLPNVLAGLCVTGTSVLFLFANKLTTAANAIVLQYAMPAVVIGLCAIFFKQRPSRLDLLASAMVLVGVVLCFLDSLGGGQFLGDILALGSAFTFAMVYFCARVPGCTPMTYAILGQCISTVFIFNLFNDPAVTAEPGPWLVALAMGLLLGCGYWLLMRGIRGANPVSAAIVSNIEPVLNPIWVFLVLGERPGPTTLVGAFVVLGTVTVYTLAKRRTTRQ